MPSAAAGSARTTSTRTCRCRPRGTPTGSFSARSSTVACAPTTSPIPIGRKEVGIVCAGGTAWCPDRRHPAQRRVRRRAPDRVLPSIDMSAASTYWKLGSSNSRLGHAPSPSPRIVRPPDVSALWSIAAVAPGSHGTRRRFLPGHADSERPATSMTPTGLIGWAKPEGKLRRIMNALASCA